MQVWDLFYDLTKELGARSKNERVEFVDVLLAKVDIGDIATSVVREWISASYRFKVPPIEIPKTSPAASASAEFGSIDDMKPGSAKCPAIGPKNHRNLPVGGRNR